jgi:hypothetical protein
MKDLGIARAGFMDGSLKGNSSQEQPSGRKICFRVRRTKKGVSRGAAPATAPAWSNFIPADKK